MPRITGGELYICALDENGEAIGGPIKLETISDSELCFHEESSEHKPLEHLKDIEVNLTIK